MIQDIKMSEFFTGDNMGYQNYYSINYDDITGRTDTVTQEVLSIQIKHYMFKKKKFYQTRI